MDTKKRKVGLLLAQGTNYGALLQSYATQESIRRLGFETIVVNYKSSRRDLLRTEIEVFFHILYSHIGANNKKPKQKLDELHRKNKEERIAAQNKFLQDRFINRTLFRDYKSLVDFGKTLSAVLIGSDQSWLPGSLFGVVTSFRFVPNNVRKISYSTSLGVSEYPRHCWRNARKVWESIDYLSVREEQGKKIIQQICGDIPVSVVCDPTYLFTKNEWLELIPIQKLEEEKYVLCYFLGTDSKLFDVARRFADCKGLKLLSILSCEVATEGDSTFADRLITGASPEDFINFIRGAEYILTDSFHGTAFSIINEKQFFLFYPKRDYLKQSRNSRLDNIVKMWGVEERLITNKEIDWNSKDIQPINYSVVTKRVLAKREESLEFLTKALSFND